MSHESEPWEICEYGDIDVLVPYIVASGGFANKDDAERAVACVNFCRQFPTEWLAEHQLHYAKESSQIDTIKNYAGLLVVVKNEGWNCSKCGKPSSGLHSCPYALEIGGNDDSDYCDCCDGCTNDCCDAI